MCNTHVLVQEPWRNKGGQVSQVCHITVSWAEHQEESDALDAAFERDTQRTPERWEAGSPQWSSPSETQVEILLGKSH